MYKVKSINGIEVVVGTTEAVYTADLILTNGVKVIESSKVDSKAIKLTGNEVQDIVNAVNSLTTKIDAWLVELDRKDEEEKRINNIRAKLFKALSEMNMIWEK